MRVPEPGISTKVSFSGSSPRFCIGPTRSTWVTSPLAAIAIRIPGFARSSALFTLSAFATSTSVVLL